MALKITSECINCDVCEDKCPNQAIFMGQDIFEIKPLSCTECVGHYDEPQCVVFCPIDCIINDPDHKETPQQLMTKYSELCASVES